MSVTFTVNKQSFKGKNATEALGAAYKAGAFGKGKEARADYRNNLAKFARPRNPQNAGKSNKSIKKGKKKGSGKGKKK